MFDIGTYNTDDEVDVKALLLLIQQHNIPHPLDVLILSYHQQLVDVVLLRELVTCHSIWRSKGAMHVQCLPRHELRGQNSFALPYHQYLRLDCGTLVHLDSMIKSGHPDPTSKNPYAYITPLLNSPFSIRYHRGIAAGLSLNDGFLCIETPERAEFIKWFAPVIVDKNGEPKVGYCSLIRFSD